VTAVTIKIIENAINLSDNTISKEDIAEILGEIP
jgi:hypothetical protein